MKQSLDGMLVEDSHRIILVLRVFSFNIYLRAPRTDLGHLLPNPLLAGKKREIPSIWPAIDFVNGKNSFKRELILDLTLPLVLKE